jgi:hypothetical protein
MKPNSEWLAEWYQHRGDLDSSIDLLCDRLDTQLSAGDFAQVDDLLRTIDLEQLGTTLLIALLAFTVAAQHKLMARAAFYDRVEQRLQLLAPTRVDELLKGLRYAEETSRDRS